LADRSPTEDDRPPKISPVLTYAPKIREVYWCRFWKDAQLPEMWKERPVIIISYKNTLTGPCLVVPTTTKDQTGNRWAHKLSFKTDGSAESWVICNQPSTVAPSRLAPFKGKMPMVSEAEFNQILGLVLSWLPKPFRLESPQEPA
jgi:mRNA interferase MazF